VALALLSWGGVNEISDSAILAALRRQLTHAVQRQTTAASNLANIDTPGYKTREATFEDALDDELGATMSLTNRAHMAGAEPTRAAMKEVEGLPERRDGNNVQLDRELLAMSTAAGDFSKAQTALAAKFRLVRYAINEGR
jgi:flagellar basal-body rod protein FlgB